jgi:hypothetical protein
MLARMTDRIEYALKSREVVAGYDQRYRRFLIDRQREAGTDLAMGIALQQRRRSTHHGN